MTEALNSPSLTTPSAETEISSQELEEYCRIEYLRCQRSFPYYLYNYVETYDVNGKVLRFPQWDYLNKIVKALDSKAAVIMVHKARKMLISWLMSAYEHWVMNFFARVGQFMVSQGEDEAQELKARAQFIHYQIPEWMRAPIQYENRSELAVLHDKNLTSASRILSLPAKPTAGRQYQGKTIWLDETAWLEYGRQIYMASKPAIEGGGRLIMTTTPNPFDTENIFKELWHRENNYVKIELYGRERPDRDAEWEKKERIDLGDALFETEYNLVEELPRGLAVYPNFNGKLSIRPLKFNPHIPVLLGIDCGFPQGTLYVQIDFSIVPHVVYILKELEGLEKFENIADFGARIVDMCQREFTSPSGKKPQFEFYGDPQHGHKTDLLQTQTRADILLERTASLGMPISVIYNNKWSRDAIPLIREKLNPQANGEPLLFIDPSCVNTIKGFRGGYHYSDRRPNGEQTFTIVKNRFSHLQNALEFIINNKLMAREEKRNYDRYQSQPRRNRYANFVGGRVGTGM